MPHKEDRRKLELLARVQKFLENAKAVHEYFYNLSPRQELFIYQLARACHLGHESVNVLNSQQQAATQGRAGSYNSVRIWKPAAFVCSTTPQVQGSMSFLRFAH